MPEMNKVQTNIPNQGFNPVTALSNKLNKAAGSFGEVGAARVHTQAAMKMQGIQHAHELTLQGNEHGHEIHKIITQGAVDMENNAANNRHERRQAILTHNNNMQKMATEHHNATGFMKTLRTHAEPGTEATFSHGNINATFTTKKKAAKAAPAQEAPAQEAPAQPAPAAPEAAPEKPKRYAYNHPVTGQLMWGDTPGGPKGTAKKTAKKAAPKKAAPKKKR